MENNDQQVVTCLNCKRVIATLVGDKMVASPEDCYAAGNITVPNCGWFCSEPCAIEREGAHGVRFERTSDGRIDYYWKDYPSR